VAVGGLGGDHSGDGDRRNGTGGGNNEEGKIILFPKVDPGFRYDMSTRGPAQWPNLFAGCNGTMQSPIDIMQTRLHNKVRRKRHREYICILHYFTHSSCTCICVLCVQNRRASGR